jgi:C-terminal processing protease CtpA/Prc
MTYCQRQTDPDPHDLDQVGLTLLAHNDDYFIAGIASQDGKTTVEGIQPGDKIVKIEGLPASGASRDAVLSVLHGRAGDVRKIVVERNGDFVTVDARVTAF